MKIAFSYHAEKRMKERGIKKKDIIDVIELPEYTIKRSDNEMEAYKKINNKMLKVVYIKMESYKKVITLYYVG